MRLVVDAGNTRVKWAFAPDKVQALAHRGRDIRTLLREDWEKHPRPRAMAVASVAGAAVNEAIRLAARDCWGDLRPIFLVSRAECCGVHVAYAQPERFGVDRLAALVAARAAAAGAPLIVVDAGTTVTVDALNAQGRHLGGVIMPGLRLLQESLLGKTAALNEVWGEPSAAAGMGEWLQQSTATGVGVGVHWMFLGGVRHAIEVAFRQTGMNARLYLSGGDAAVLAKALPWGYEVRPNLVLEGISLMAWSV